MSELDAQGKDRLERLTEKTHRQEQEIIDLKRRLGIAERNNEQLTEILDRTEPEALAEARILAGPPGSVTQRTEVDLPVQNVPLSAALSPADGKEVPQDPPAAAFSTPPPTKAPKAAKWEREYYCKLVLSIIDSKELFHESRYVEAVHARADMLLTRARERFPRRP